MTRRFCACGARVVPGTEQCALCRPRPGGLCVSSVLIDLEMGWLKPEQADLFEEGA